VNGSADNVKSRNWVLPFIATLVAMFTMQMSNLGFSPLLPSMQADLGMSFTQLGLFTGIYGILALATSVPAGFAAKQFGEKKVLVLGLIGLAIGSVLLGQAQSFGSAITFRGLSIFGYRFSFVCVLIAIALTAPAAMRGRAMGILGATSAMASVVGSPLGGELVDSFGWRSAILGYAGMALFGAMVFGLFYRPAVAPATVQDADDEQPGLGKRSPYASPVLWLLTLVVGLGGFGQFTITHFIPSVAEGVYGLDAGAAGLIISVGYICAIIMNLIIGVLADRFHKLAVLGVMFVLMIVASGSMTIENETAFRIASAAVISVGFSATNQLYGLAGVLMPRREAAHAMGMVSLGAGLFGYFGPQLLGILRDVTGAFNAGFYLVMFSDMVALALFGLLYRLTRSWKWK
jgi:predicted MFS family arabinose efflux permease